MNQLLRGGTFGIGALTAVLLLVAGAVPAAAGSVEEALHLGLGEEVLAAAIDGRIAGFGRSF